MTAAAKPAPAKKTAKKTTKKAAPAKKSASTKKKSASKAAPAAAPGASGGAPLSVEPGQMVRVKIVRRPASERATKTLARVLAKDPANRAEQRARKLSRRRAMTSRQRGGRQWEHRPTRIAPFRGEVGEQSTVLATLDVIKDLNSVRRFIEVSTA